MKNRIFLYFLFSFLVIGSCKQQDMIAELKDRNSRDLTIAEAKTYFEKNILVNKNEIVKLASSGLSGHVHDENCTHGPNSEKQAMWDGAEYKSLLSGATAVVTPIHRENSYIQVSDSLQVKYGFLNYLMMYKDSLDNVVTEWVTLKPSLKWLESKTARKYDGHIVVKSWEGKIKKILYYVDGSPTKLRGSSRKVFEKLASKNKIAGSDDEIVCLVTKVFTFNPSTCPCEGHTYAQIGQCVCHTKPTQGFGSITMEVTIDCPPEDLDGPDPDFGSGGSGGAPLPNGGGVGSGDYPPTDCNPDPNYTMPTTPPPAGQDYAIPCSATAVPAEPVPDPGPTAQPLPVWDYLRHIFSFYGKNLPAPQLLSNEESQQLIDFISQREDNEDLVEMAYWGIQEMTAGNITWDQFENWFLKTADFNDNYDIDETLIEYDEVVQQNNLPSFQDFLSHFPKNTINGNYVQMPAKDVYTLAGGTLLNSFNGDPVGYGNACSIRGSRGLLYSNISIPVLKYNGSQRTQKGADNKNYILDAVSFNKFMKDKFGETTYKLEGDDANDPKKIAELLKGKNGIYVIINKSPSEAGYSGHVDAIINGRCVGAAYTTPKGKVKSIRIWKLD